MKSILPNLSQYKIVLGSNSPRRRELLAGLDIDFEVQTIPDIDTIVWTFSEILGKPKDREDAIAMLRKLSGHVHEVITGVCITTKEKTVSFSASSTVCFARLDDDEIVYYVDKYRPFDKAGSYGIQEWIGYVAVEAINGSFYNVMGLPVRLLYQELKKF